ncbi:MAG TPA: cobalt ECF transporter T component CbiQ [Phototrophicaceae bacterium]|nr:cobalt ECF transporter T component CbiQ [Phototrophicaceae bacterium]
MNTFLLERYQTGDSLLHQLDPRVKMIVTLLLILGIVITPPAAWPAYPLLWALVASLAALGRLSVGNLARKAAIALPFTLAAMTLIFTTPGQTISTILGLPVTDTGLVRFIAVIFKSWLAVQAALLLAMTTHLTDLLWALQSLRLPATLVAVIAFMYRYLFTLQNEAERLLRARTARSGITPDYRSGGSLLWRARIAGGMVGNLFLRSFERSERIYAAMLARGYTGVMHQLTPPTLTRRTVILGSLPVLALALIELLAFIWWS